MRSLTCLSPGVEADAVKMVSARIAEEQSRSKCKLRRLGAAALLAVALCLSPSPAEPSVIVEAGQTNVFLSDEQAQVHLLHRPKERIIFAFPAENSGVGLWYTGSVELRPDSLASRSDDQGQTVSAEFTVIEPISVKKVVLDNLRVLRGYAHGEPIVEQVERARADFATGRSLNEAWAHPQTRLTEGRFVVERFQPGFGLYQLVLEGSDVRLDEGQMRIGSGPLKVTARCPFPSMPGLTLEELLSSDFYRGVDSLSEREKKSLEALQFLSSKDKMMAGSWRFLTYFGRDTMISLSMLEPVLSDQAIENGIVSVLTRLSEQGAVAHEEDIGSWAEWRHLEEQPPRLSLAPVYDYKMIDDDLLLPVLYSEISRRGREEVASRLLAAPAFRQALLKNADYNLARLQPKRPLLLNKGESVGEWRDSEVGLGGGVDPYSVNGGLTVRALKGLAEFYRRLGDSARAGKAESLVPHFESIADRFWKKYDKSELEARLKKFAASRPPLEERFLLRRWDEMKSRIDAQVWLPVLSFNADGTANEVSHTDVAFNLFYGDLSEARFERILKFLELPFPVGVITEAGPIVANPAFSSNPEHYRTLGPGQYHGMVVWSWQSAMLQLGLARQLSLRPKFEDRIRAVIARLQAGEEAAGELGTSELWGISFSGDRVEARPYGEGGDETESNAMQLWSTVHPAVRYTLRKLNSL